MPATRGVGYNFASPVPSNSNVGAPSCGSTNHRTGPTGLNWSALSTPDSPNQGSPKLIIGNSEMLPPNLPSGISIPIDNSRRKQPMLRQRTLINLSSERLYSEAKTNLGQQLLPSRQQPRILGSPSNSMMQPKISGLRGRQLGSLLILQQRSPNLLGVRRVPALRSRACDQRLHQMAHIERTFQFIPPRPERVTHRPSRVGRPRSTHERPAGSSPPDLQQSSRDHPGQRVPDRRAAHAQLRCQLAFRREALAGGELAQRYRGHDPVGEQLACGRCPQWAEQAARCLVTVARVPHHGSRLSPDQRPGVVSTLRDQSTFARHSSRAAITSGSPGASSAAAFRSASASSHRSARW